MLDYGLTERKIGKGNVEKTKERLIGKTRIKVARLP